MVAQNRYLGYLYGSTDPVPLDINSILPFILRRTVSIIPFILREDFKYNSIYGTVYIKCIYDTIYIKRVCMCDTITVSMILFILAARKRYL